MPSPASPSPSPPPDSWWVLLTAPIFLWPTPSFNYHLSLYATLLHPLWERWEVGWGSYSHVAASNLFTLYTYHFQLVLVVESMADSHLLKDMGWISLGRMHWGTPGGGECVYEVTKLIMSSKHLTTAFEGTLFLEAEALCNCVSLIKLCFVDL